MDAIMISHKLSSEFSVLQKRFGSVPSFLELGAMEIPQSNDCFTVGRGGRGKFLKQGLACLARHAQL